MIKETIKVSGEKLCVCPLLAALLLFNCGGVAGQQVWTAQAPGPNTHGQVENINDGEVVGAINRVAAHPSNANIVYVGAVNGGIWKTTNAMAASPSWEHQSDGYSSLSVGALKFDPTDPTGMTLVAGLGHFSSFGRDGGALSGLLRTTDGGATWTGVGGATLKDLNISGVAPRGAVIVVAANDAVNPVNAGIWRSTDGGATWKHVSGDIGTGLNAGPSADLAGDPSNPNRLFTNAGNSGLFRSNDAGATWAKVSNAEMDGLMAGAGNVKVSVGASNNVYVAAVAQGRLAGVFRSGDGGTSWTTMDLPTTTESGGSVYGTHPGEQGGIHISIAADRKNPNVVYVGGDRQPCFTEQFGCRHPTIPTWPNSIGARDYSGRLFRGDASKPRGSQWAHLTHSRTLGAAGGGTASGSAPHADSRDMAMTADGTLIEVDDGGVYRRSSPQTNTGDWFSMNGDIQVTEFHAVAWDSNSHLVIGGAQDTGTPAQHVRSNVRWQSISTGDGGVVAVDNTSSPGRSIRYSSFYDLFDFRRQVYDASDVLQSTINPALLVTGGGNPLEAQFYTPIKLNNIAPTRLVIGAANSVYESLDQGDTITEIGPHIAANETGPAIIAYGARGNPDVLYVGSDVRVFVRKTAPPSPLTQSQGYPGGFVVGIAINPDDPKVAYVIDPDRVFRTTDMGGTWTNITGNLARLTPGTLRSITYVNNIGAGSIVVGGNNGVFMAPGAAFNSWSKLGTGLPGAPTYCLDYNSADRVLLAGTLGRGAWTLTFPGPVRRMLRGAPVRPSTKHATADIISTEAAGLQSAVNRPPEQDQKDAAALQLSPGVVVNTAERRLYIMSPDGGIDAVDLVHGERVWSTKTAAKPLGIVGRNLLGQAESPAAEGGLKIVVLDQATGNQVTAGTEQLPAGIQPSVAETLKGRFVVTAQPAGIDAVIGWQFVQRPRRGVRPDTRDALSQPGGFSNFGSGGTSQGGAFRLDLSTGTTTNLGGGGFIAPQSVETYKLLPDAERMEVGAETQYLSADGRHFIVTRRTADDRALEKYTLTVYDRATRARIGEFKSYQSVVPFVVADNSVIFETESYSRQTGAGMVEEPVQIHALDLKTGKEEWSHQIRDTKYRGPFPP